MSCSSAGSTRYSRLGGSAKDPLALHQHSSRVVSASIICGATVAGVSWLGGNWDGSFIVTNHGSKAFEVSSLIAHCASEMSPSASRTLSKAQHQSLALY